MESQVTLLSHIIMNSSYIRHIFSQLRNLSQLFLCSIELHTQADLL